MYLSLTVSPHRAPSNKYLLNSFPAIPHSLPWREAGVLWQARSAHIPQVCLTTSQPSHPTDWLSQPTAGWTAWSCPSPAGPATPWRASIPRRASAARTPSLRTAPTWTTPAAGSAGTPASTSSTGSSSQRRSSAMATALTCSCRDSR